jgi:diketogulonate reductase-like aldo/keto reductase
VVKYGLAKHIGVSNFSVELIEEARSYLSTADITAVQNRMSVADKEYLQDVVPYTKRAGMMFMAYTPLETGRLASNRILSEVATRYGKTAVQVALNWLICLESVVPIPKAGKVKHVEENAGAAGWRLRQEDWQLIHDSVR